MFFMSAGEVRRQVVDTFYMKHHLRLQFDRWRAKSEARRTWKGSTDAQTALAAICSNGQNPPWKASYVDSLCLHCHFQPLQKDRAQDVWKIVRERGEMGFSSSRAKTAQIFLMFLSTGEIRCPVCAR